MKYHVYSPMLEGYVAMDLSKDEAERRAAERTASGEKCYIVPAEG